MADEQEQVRAPTPVSVDMDPGLLGTVPGWPLRWGGSDSVITVFVAMGANLLVAVVKSVVAAITGSASLAAEAAHSWADTGNEVFLVVANRRSARPIVHTRLDMGARRTCGHYWRHWGCS